MCSWCAHDRDVHVQEHVLTHKEPGLGVCHKHFGGCICFSVGMVIFFPVFPLPVTVLPGPCESVLVRVPVHVHAWSCARGGARQPCPSPVFWGVPVSICGCVCAARCLGMAAGPWPGLCGLSRGSVRSVGLEPVCAAGTGNAAPAAPGDASPDTAPASVCPKREDGEGTARCQEFFLHKQGYLGPTGA